MKLFEKIYPQRVEGDRFYYAGGMFFDAHGCKTNIPRRKRRHYQVPASNPEYAGKFLSVRVFIQALKNIEKFGISFVLVQFLCYFVL